MIWKVYTRAKLGESTKKKKKKKKKTKKTKSRRKRMRTYKEMRILEKESCKMYKKNKTHIYEKS
jgi:hypothetical protein